MNDFMAEGGGRFWPGRWIEGVEETGGSYHARSNRARDAALNLHSRAAVGFRDQGDERVNSLHAQLLSATRRLFGIPLVWGCLIAAVADERPLAPEQRFSILEIVVGFSSPLSNRLRRAGQGGSSG